MFVSFLLQADRQQYPSNTTKEIRKTIFLIQKKKLFKKIKKIKRWTFILTWKNHIETLSVVLKGNNSLN